MIKLIFTLLGLTLLGNMFDRRDSQPEHDDDSLKVLHEPRPFVTGEQPLVAPAPQHAAPSASASFTCRIDIMPTNGDPAEGVYGYISGPRAVVVAMTHNMADQYGEYLEERERG